ncbi:MAG: methylated-DNA--[protein]-cysteine S-methyltransferase [Bacteroidetes bacterium]|nr:methylated-DNA--[protein]-cysteine S-methyltransferase [Bacteroidota bacterium]MBS1539956.1 methylated-DNA--[protein]-cysteine S-methyltransferase [Bacteroidota bacterium]
MKKTAYYASPVGELCIESENEKIVAISFNKDSRQEVNTSPVIDLCIAELEDYFSGKRKFFSFEMELRGTDFQKRVWNELLNIPFGKTISYEELAICVGNIKSIRAVGLANGQNPIAIVVPCHRVIGKRGDLVGYSGGLENKKWLLQHEGVLTPQLSMF